MRPATDALIVIDVQNDFCPGGALAVAGGDEIIARINVLMAEFQTVVLTQDWHPADHASFAANHPGAEPFSMTEMPYGPQVLWPTHCVQGTSGAEFHTALRTDPAQLVIRKGFRPAIDSYSAFFENDRTTATGLEGYLRNEFLVHGLPHDVYLWAVDSKSIVGARRDSPLVNGIRPAQITDLQTIFRLSHELGYSPGLDEVECHLAKHRLCN